MSFFVVFVVEPMGQGNELFGLVAVAIAGSSISSMLLHASICLSILFLELKSEINAEYRIRTISDMTIDYDYE